MKRTFSKIQRYVLVLLAFWLINKPAFAQLRPVAAQYFNNPYFINPAFAGKEDGLVLNMAYSFKAENLQGGYTVQAFTAGYHFKKSGIGVTIQNDENGSLSTRMAKLTYSYHVKMNEKSDLSFGISAGGRQERFDLQSASGIDPTDPFPAEFNSRKPNYDVDFGTALTSNNFTLQASVLNIKSILDKFKNAGFVNFLYLQTTFRIQLGSKTAGSNIQPLFAFTGIHNAKNRTDMGMRVNILENQIGFLGLYHSDKSFSSGMNIHLKQGFTLQGIYHSSSSIYGSVNAGTFELALRTNLTRK